MKIARSEETATTSLSEECIVLDINNGEYFGLEGALMELWLELETGTREFDQILSKWKREFDQSEAELTDILQNAIQELWAKNLVKVDAS
ncbi:PqqD family peptide modification chaperone [Paenibacillus sp. W2I17]|uniref:PqqD family peptide modification chaperone n=1 Tax=Paenibacillus sp. W2I17 TaxID=3042311 RepID=UPI00277FC1A8|nr:PqqD family peptide modification chaperone [Paenibacillus sp. W2I17]MDQ0659837.1 frataxin-like iron-binding protein CyaY [Paenibacillus sp. W2I17]